MNVQASIGQEKVAGILMRLEACGIKLSTVSQLIHLGLQAIEDRYGPALRPDPHEALEYLMKYKAFGGFGHRLRPEDLRPLARASQAGVEREISGTRSIGRDAFSQVPERPANRPAFQLSPEALAFARSMGFGGASERTDSAERSEAVTDSGHNIDADNGQAVEPEAQAMFDALGFRRPSPLFAEPVNVANPAERSEAPVCEGVKAEPESELLGASRGAAEKKEG